MHLPTLALVLVTTIPLVTIASPIDTGIVKRGAPSIDDQTFQAVVIQAHNDVRARHGTPALVWDNSIAQSALSFVSSGCQNDDPNDTPYGANYYIIGLSNGASFNFDTYDPIYNGWYFNELPNYDFNQPSCTDDNCHMTQVVWKSTSHVGCAWQPDSRVCYDSGGLQTWVLVCEYQDQGNIIGAGSDEWQYFLENVPPPTS